MLIKHGDFSCINLHWRPTIKLKENKFLFLVQTGSPKSPDVGLTTETIIISHVAIRKEIQIFGGLSRVGPISARARMIQQKAAHRRGEMTER